jgi:2-amino-4-hydroxy-6-hydroxymethyldihydropteridine diphosphokinase
MKSIVYVGLGSNVEREKNIRLAIMGMRQDFGQLRLSPVYESEAVGFDGDDFLNLVAGFETDTDVRDVVRALRKIEDQLGRDRSLPRFSHRPIDLDILTYDELKMDEEGIQIPRHEILVNAFVLRPLQDIAPDSLHPLAKKSYRELWQAMASTAVHTETFNLRLD